MTKQGEIIEEEYREWLEEIMTRKSDSFNLVKDAIIFKCPKCGFADEIILSFREKPE